MIAGAVDLHKRYGQYFLAREGKEPVEARLDNDRAQITRFLAPFPKEELGKSGGGYS